MTITREQRLVCPLLGFAFYDKIIGGFYITHKFYVIKHTCLKIMAYS